MSKIIDDNLVLRWIFGETEARPTSLQAYDMLECSIAFASKLFPNSRKVINYNSLKTEQALLKLKSIAKYGVELFESKSLDFKMNKNVKNSFWKYFPIRMDISKYELILDNDIVFWGLPKTIQEWLNSEGLLINSDWNGANYGAFEKAIPSECHLNAGVIGYPPQFDFSLPDFSNFPDLFHSEQGFIVKTFISSDLELFILTRNEVFQTNTVTDLTSSSIIDMYQGAHFCGCSYCHFFHWDKNYKDLLWDKYYKL